MNSQGALTHLKIFCKSCNLDCSFGRVFIWLIIITGNMASKNFLLVSLEEDKAKELAQIVSNDVCRQILDCLAQKESTETELSQKLAIPLSTVHYNLKQLVKSGIVKAGEFHYSEKGREILHYSLANKYIIIAPKSTATESLANKLKRILPVFLIVAATGVVIQLVGRFMGSTARSFGVSAAAPLMGEASKTTAPLLQRAAEAAGNVTAAPAYAPLQQVVRSQPIALWFIAGALFALVVFLVYDAIRSRRKEP